MIAAVALALSPLLLAHREVERMVNALQRAVASPR